MKQDDFQKFMFKKTARYHPSTNQQNKNTEVMGLSPQLQFIANIIHPTRNIAEPSVFAKTNSIMICLDIGS